MGTLMAFSGSRKRTSRRSLQKDWIRFVHTQANGTHRPSVTQRRGNTSCLLLRRETIHTIGPDWIAKAASFCSAAEALRAWKRNRRDGMYRLDDRPAGCIPGMPMSAMANFDQIQVWPNHLWPKPTLARLGQNQVWPSQVWPNQLFLANVTKIGVLMF